MRTLLPATLAIAVLSLTAAQAHAAPWCAYYSRGGTNCGFYSLAQCRAAVSGVGGFCQRNAWESSPRRQRRDY
jgi:hypothetical protein